MRHMLRHPIRFRRDHRFTMAHASDFLDGELDESAARRIGEYASLCPKCRELLDALRRTLEGLRGLRPAPDPGVVDGVLDTLRRSRAEHDHGST